MVASNSAILHTKFALIIFSVNLLKIVHGQFTFRITTPPHFCIVLSFGAGRYIVLSLCETKYLLIQKIGLAIS